MTFVDHNRQCPECLKWYGRRYYKSGQIEPPCNFKRRLTCGDSACVKSSHRKKRALSRVMTRSSEAIDLFIYGRVA